MLLIDLCSILKMIYKTENKAILFFPCLRKRIDFVNETELEFEFDTCQAKQVCQGIASFSFRMVKKLPRNRESAPFWENSDLISRWWLVKLFVAFRTILFFPYNEIDETHGS